MKTRAPRKDTKEQRKAWKAATKKNFEALPEDVKEARKQAVRDRVNASRVEKREEIRQRANELYHCRYKDNAKEYMRQYRERRKADPEARARDLEYLRKWQLDFKFKSPRMTRAVRAAKARAIAKGMGFDITAEDLYTPELCPVFGEALDYYGNGSSVWTASLDRIDNSKGYIAGNVWVISRLANTMKSNASFDELETFAIKMLEKVKEWRRDKR